MHSVHKLVVGSLLTVLTLLSISVVVIGDNLSTNSTDTVLLDNVSNQTNDMTNTSINTTFADNSVTIDENTVMGATEKVSVDDAVTAALSKHPEKLSATTRNIIRSAEKEEKKDIIIKYHPGFDTKKFSLTKDFVRLHISVASMKKAELAQLLDDDFVDSVEIDQDIHTQADAISWNIARVGANTAWNTTTGNGVTVAILDSGVSSHDDLNVVGGWNIVDDDNNYADAYGHGTMVAGVVGALTNNQGIVGVSPNVDLYAVKITNGSVGRLSDAIAGVQWAIEHNVSIILMSFGITSYSQVLRDELQLAHDQGILLIAASGNDGANQVLYPAAYDSVIAVGAIDENNVVASFSNYGNKLELVAPGVDINSTALGNTYAVAQGTSLAAPHVAGVAALLWSYNRSLTNDQVRAKLDADALDLGAIGKDDYYGYGLVQINLSTTNLTLQNTSYYYEIYNISSFNLSNQTIMYWTNGTGSIQDLQFSSGYYLFEKNHSLNQTFYVGENGTIVLLLQVSHILFDDNWTNAIDSNATDGVVWNDSRYIRTKVDTTDQVGECWDYDASNSSYDECIFIDSATKSSCQSQCDSHGVLGTSASCKAGTIGVYHTLLNGTNSILNKTVRYHGISSSCGTPNAEVYANYYVVNKRRFNCTVDGNFTYQGKFGFGNYDWTNVGGEIVCGYGKVCDSYAYQQETNISLQPLSICRVPDGSSCSQDIDCFTNHVCKNGVCQLANQTCFAGNGTIFVNTLDYKSNPVSGVSVYLNGVFNSSSSYGLATIRMPVVNCVVDQNVSVKCADNTTACGVSQSTRIVVNNSVRSLFFDCSVCLPSTKELYIGQSDVSINLSSGVVSVMVHSVGINNNSVVVNVSRQDASGLIKNSANVTVGVTSGNVAIAYVPLVNLSQSDYVHVYVVPTPDDTLKTNNYVFRPVLKSVSAYLQVHTDSAVANSVITDYLSSFVNVVNSSSTADVIIDVGPDFSLLWNGSLSVGLQNVTRPYAGSVRLVPSGTSAPARVYVQGNGLEGDISSVKRLVNARNIFLNKDLYSSTKSYVSYVTDFDSLGIGVADHLHNAQAQSYYRQNNSGFQAIVHNILFDNNFEVSIMTVKTLNTTSYNQSTILRVKHVSTDFSDNYASAYGINNTFPIVFSGGIFSNLETWEGGGTGLAKQMANEGHDVWEIEITGGPNTECDSCANYTYDDLVDHYWPASIAGIIKYSGKNQINYIGHSNGGRVALSSLNKYSSGGKNSTGYYFDYNSGQYLSDDLSAKPVSRFVGVAVPIVLNKKTDGTNTTFTYLVRRSETTGMMVMQRLQGYTHVKLGDYTARLAVNPNIFSATDILTFVALQQMGSNDKISYNLMNYYHSLANDSNSSMNLSGVVVDRLYLMNANTSDIIVPFEDQNYAFNQAGLNASITKQGYAYQKIIGNITFGAELLYNHMAMKSSDDVKKDIVAVLK